MSMLRISDRQFYWYWFACGLLVWLPAWLILFPGIIAPDFLQQWQQAIGVEPLNDWHPASSSLALRVLMLFGKSPAVITILQTLGLVAVVAYALLTARRVGAGKLQLIIAALLFYLHPLHWYFSQVAWKDFPFALAVLWLSCQMANIAGSNLLWLKGKLAAPLLTISLLLLLWSRHNGIVIVVPTILLLVISAFRNKAVKVTKPTILILAYTLTAALVMRLLIYPAFQVDQSQRNIVAAHLPLHHLSAIVNSGVPLNHDEVLLLEELLPLADWQRCYYPNSVTTLVFDPVFISKQHWLQNNHNYHKLLLLWGQLLLRNPLVIIRHHLLVANPLWRITPDIPTYVLPTENLYLPYQPKPLFPALRQQMIEFFFNHVVAPRWGWITYRPAIWIFTLLILGLPWIILPRSRLMLIALAPIFMHLAFFTLYAVVQDTRLYYPIILLVALVVGISGLSPTAQTERSTETVST